MLASTSGRSIFGLRIEPRSPPVQVATWTSTPSATYFAVRRGALARLVVGVGVHVHQPEPGAVERHGRESTALGEPRMATMSDRGDRTARRSTRAATARRRRGAAGAAGHRRARVVVAVAFLGLAGLDGAVPRRPRGDLRAGRLRRRRRPHARPRGSPSASTTTTSWPPACCARSPRTTRRRRRAHVRGHGRRPADDAGARARDPHRAAGHHGRPRSAAPPTASSGRADPRSLARPVVTLADLSGRRDPGGPHSRTASRPRTGPDIPTSERVRTHRDADHRTRS